MSCADLGITTLERLTHLRPVTSRGCGLGGSEVAAIMGMSPYAGPFDVYARKVGLIGDIGGADNRKKWGRRLEKLIAEAYSEEIGEPVHWFDKTLQHMEREFQIMTPDAFVLTKPRGVDAKNVAVDQAWKWGEPGSCDIPDEYGIQTHWYLSGTKLDAWDVPALFGGNDMRIFTVLPDQGIEDVLLEEADKFWRHHVRAGVAPPMGATNGAAQYLKERFPKSIGDIREADLSEHALVAEWRHVCDELASAKKREEELSNQIKGLIGPDQGMKLEEGDYVTWREQERAGFTVKPAKFRVLRYHQAPKARKGKR